MRVAIIAPVANTGNTTAATMIAAALACTQGVETTLMCTTTKARRLHDYLGIEYEEDITASITQLYELIRSNAIAPGECQDYLHKVTKNLMVLDTTSKGLSEDDRTAIMSHLFKSEVTPITVCDVHWKPDLLTDENSLSILEAADLIFVQVNGDLKNIEAFKRLKDTGLLPDKRYALLVNSFDERAASIRHWATAFDFKVRYTAKLHRSPYIQMAEEKGELLSVVANALTDDPRVIELKQDFKEICQIITSHAKMRMKWEV